MKLLHNNEELIFLSLIVFGAIVMGFAIGYDYRGGNEWAFTQHTVREVLSAIARIK